MLAVIAAFSLAPLGACGRTAGADAFDQRVHDYIMAHPEVIQQALQKQEDDEAVTIQRRAQTELPKVRAALERDPGDFVANPGGMITVTEFYDYRCPHCVNAAPKVIALVRSNPNIRFVFKEMPIFGAVSEHAARAALAVKANGGDYLGFYEAMMASHGLDEAAMDKLAVTKGARLADLSSLPAAVKHLADTAGLFNRLSLGGTPAFIVGDTVVFGEDMVALNTAIAKAAKPNPAG